MPNWSDSNKGANHSAQEGKSSLGNLTNRDGHLTLTSIFAVSQMPDEQSEVIVPEAVVAVQNEDRGAHPSVAGINFDARLGTYKAQRLVELLGGVSGIFKASLTELEALQAVSAQLLGTGRSLDLTREELLRHKKPA